MCHANVLLKIFIPVFKRIEEFEKQTFKTLSFGYSINLSCHVYKNMCTCFKIRPYFYTKNSKHLNSNSLKAKLRTNVPLR